MPRTAPIVLAAFMLAGSPATADDGAFFRQHVAPIFERHCVSCHGGAKPKGGLVLVDRKQAAAGGESGAVIEPGKPDKSLLFQYISGKKPEMPKDAAPLSADQVAAVRRWIAEGANWPEGLTLADKKTINGSWWSLEPLAKVAVPAMDSPWVRTPVDAFVLAKLGEQHLTPSAEADRRTLIRRLTYDLHGLPPTPEEIDAFLADVSGDAYANLVDRLLASPRYGERWGRYWLDVVHFGESHGYDKDKPRPNAWPYRDYVIHSLNEDKPYDRFVEEQIAGDVLYPFDPQATVATGFIAAGPWDFVGHVELREGTVDKDIARSNDRDDMVANTMSTFASLTVHCARCHNHKFDPIRQEDYYALQAVFAGVDRADRPYDVDPRVAEERKRRSAEKAALDERLAKLRERVDRITSPEIASLDAGLSQWKAELAALPAEKPSKTLGYHSQIMPTQDETKWVQVDLGRSMSVDRIVLVPAHVVYGGHPGPGFGFPPRFRVEVSESADFAEKQTVVDHTTADFPHPGDKPYRIAGAGTTGRYVRVTASKLWKRTDDWIFAIAELLVFSGSENVALAKPVTSLDSIEAPPSWATKNLVDGYSSLAQIVVDDATGRSRRQVLEEEIEKAAASRRQLVDARLDEGTRKELASVECEIKDLDHRISALPKPRMVYAGTSQFAAQGSFSNPQLPRPIHLLARGDVRSPQQLVAAAPVACVRGPEAQFVLAKENHESERRAALARWLGDARNALVRRSIVNRIWHYHFGQGIVDTPNDFGRMGSLPTHPELLEWLAGWLIDHGHSLKELHRLLLSSAVYRQSSQTRGEYAKLDAGNRYLWRMNRQRLDAESIRDAMLAVSGKLDLTMGGPSVQQFYFKDDHSPVYDYTRFDVDDARGLRRSVYRFLVRSVPDPFMECLDCADPSIMTPKRNTTLTSIQALALLNNPFATRQAEHFAERVGELRSDLPAQIEAAYRLALGRKPNDREAAALIDYATRHGLANACRVIFNSNEFVFID